MKNKTITNETTLHKKTNGKEQCKGNFTLTQIFFSRLNRVSFKSVYTSIESKHSERKLIDERKP